MKSRLFLAGALAGVILILFGIRMLDSAPARTEAVEEPARRIVQQRVTAVVDTLLRSYGIDPKGVRTWLAGGPAKAGSRVEQRVFVPPSFVSLAFNHDLNLALSPIGAHVVATERTRENLVTMHIVCDGTTIRSIAFMLNPE